MTEDARAIYEQYQERLSDLYTRLNDLHAQISDIDQQQSSFIVSAWQFLGYNEANVLEDKKRDILAEIDSLNVQVASFQKAAEPLLAKLREEEIKERREVIQQQRLIEERKYLEDPDKFFDEILFENLDSLDDFFNEDSAKDVISKLSTEKIYANAKRVIAASAVINTLPNTYRMIMALRVVAEARDRAFDEYRSASQETDIAATEQKFAVLDEFTEGAKTCFFNMVDKLDNIGCQSLKLLYLTDPERAEWYFDQPGIATDPKVLEQLNKEIDAQQLKVAKAILADINGFNSLPEPTKKELIKQQKYVNNLNFDLLLVKDDAKFKEFNNYLAIVSANIKNAILNNKSAEQIAQESADIQQKIQQEASDIRRRVFKQQLTESAYIPIGAGCGVAWLFGMGVPTAVALSAIAAFAKATVETSDSRLQMPTIEAAQKIADEQQPTAYNFLEEADKLWNKDRLQPVEKPVVIKTINNDAQEFIANAQYSPILKNLYIAFVGWPTAIVTVISYLAEQAWSTAKDNALFIVAAMAIILTVSLATPAGWPFAISMGLALVAGIAAYSLPPVKDYVDSTINKMREFFSFKRNIKDMSNYLRKAPKINPDQSLQELNKVAPRLDTEFSAQLATHFNKRLNNIQSQLDMVKSSNDPETIAKITNDLQNLEKDWSKIKSFAKKYEKNPAAFYESIENYLEESYKSAKETYLSLSRSTQKPVVFGDNEKPHKMAFKVDHVVKQQDIKDLIDFKDKVAKYKRDSR